MESAAEAQSDVPIVETVANTSSQDPNVAASSSQQPVAQQGDALGEPVPGSARGEAHAAQAAAENTAPPNDAQPEASQQYALPDLRQGIPSTFDFEFGGKKAAPAETIKEDGVDLTSGETPREYRSGEGRDNQGDYDRSAYETSLDRRRAKMANYLYGGILLFSLTSCIYFARPYGLDEEVPPGLEPEHISSWGPGSMWARIKSRMGSQVGYYTEPTFPKLLPDMPADQRNPYTLVLSLEDLLVNSSWTREHGWRTAKR